jgi:F0F1-type ATP synthase assembly protein I
MKVCVRQCFLILMAAQGALWVVLGVLREMAGSMDSIALLMFLNAALFIFFAFLYRKTRWLTALTMTFLAGNLVLSLTDQTGALDFIVFALDAAGLALLIADMKILKSGRRS